MKIIGAVLLIASGLSAGLLRALEMKRRERICRQFGSLCIRLMNDVQYRATPVADLLDCLLQEEDYRLLSFCSSDCIRHLCILQSPLSSEENARTASFLYSLGKSDADSQLALIREFQDYMEERRLAYAAQYQRNARVYTALGLFGSAVLALIMI